MKIHCRACVCTFRSFILGEITKEENDSSQELKSSESNIKHKFFFGRSKMDIELFSLHSVKFSDNIKIQKI